MFPHSMFNALIYIVPILGGAITVFAILMMCSSRVRGKMMSKQVKATRYMIDESKDDIESISTDMANATKEGIETTTRAIRRGLTEDEEIYCKYCGARIDADSRFCKSCGRQR